MTRSELRELQRMADDIFDDPSEPVTADEVYVCLAGSEDLEDAVDFLMNRYVITRKLK